MGPTVSRCEIGMGGAISMIVKLQSCKDLPAIANNTCPPQSHRLSCNYILMIIFYTSHDNRKISNQYGQ